MTHFLDNVWFWTSVDDIGCRPSGLHGVAEIDSWQILKESLNLGMHFLCGTTNRNSHLLSVSRRCLKDKRISGGG